jgi:hypothetical protein
LHIYIIRKEVRDGKTLMMMKKKLKLKKKKKRREHLGKS